ncbi:hypothetical protein Micbo1qcDRAFT_174074 [Microdochium bolleyi]|uniref:Uncharacterized protein n=1 Tax=Microdochium bolleyi TaxID=196109 RepID=A0A136J6Y5_9PEZI|nr:hypothetical protein Micbo1qcDRAFT_174074 [Microdochium bolleyi]
MTDRLSGCWVAASFFLVSMMGRLFSKHLILRYLTGSRRAAGASQQERDIAPLRLSGRPRHQPVDGQQRSASTLAYHDMADPWILPTCGEETLVGRAGGGYRMNRSSVPQWEFGPLCGRAPKNIHVVRDDLDASETIGQVCDFVGHRSSTCVIKMQLGNL